MRPFDPSRDTDLYVEGYCEAFRESYPGVSVTVALAASYRESLANFGTVPGLAAFTTDSDGAPAGFIVLAVTKMDAVRQVSVQAIYVAEAFRRRGIGRTLLAQAASYAQRVGASSTRLDVSVTNKAALALYESVGYVVTRYEMEKLNQA